MTLNIRRFASIQLVLVKVFTKQEIRRIGYYAFTQCSDCGSKCSERLYPGSDYIPDSRTAWL